MEFSQLKAFICVAENHSFSITANQLHLTQPAISKRISTLEEQLGCILFDRIGHHIQLTQAGEVLLPRAIKVLQEVEDCKKQLHRLNDCVSGKLALASSHHIGLHRLPEILKTYAKEYQDVDLDFQFIESEQACEAVRTGQIELAVITLPLEPDGKLQTIELWNDPLICMVNKEHPMCTLSEVCLEQLASYSMLLPEKETFTRQIIERPFFNHQLKLKARMTTNELESLRMMVEIGLGWSILPKSMLREPLVEIQVVDLHLDRKLGLVRNKDRILSSSAEAMINLLLSTRDVRLGV
ncbi:MAG: LysR family transcriptional regulator [Gammaproteobacteria bacterium]|nr:LysR family transcriptional regulator [Gammaproteobacteria bacterium]